MQKYHSLDKIIRTTVRSILAENSEISTRIDNAFDWMSKHNAKASDQAFQDYVEYSNKNLDKIENLVKEINKSGKMWFADMSMFFTSTLDDLDDINDPGEINIRQSNVEIFYKYTYAYGNSVHDRYKIIFNKGVSDELLSEDLMKLLENGAIGTEYGIVGLSPDAVKRRAESLGWLSF